MLDKNTVLVSAACVFKDVKGKPRWFFVKQGDVEGWEIPKVLVRKGESSVRAALRMMGEKGGMSTRVLEEAGRAGGATTINGRSLPQRHIYYLMVARSLAGEAIGFPEFLWLEYSKALKRIDSKRDKTMLKAAKETLEKLKKENQRKKINFQMTS
ncbi:hypothetical protein A2865_01995 [Candidatus Woesebacteria bacterium RIFCSPHIGHO2_01_FULL_39_17]|uniref:Uncharacterized protein n=3 Tax=Candidatus Woeseibacteriota TaxID=1752722 RepID=A0A0G0NLF2_9BACT|nr:MAG: hypothetical protein US72_C0004G0021 [Microgenomates group bacterium GW2011_GWC1_38_12]KKQ93618.1 MAG: hypothetical protein UT19_C0009G0027 [Candidatus Woesebacteria bacterium GW2011_GWB1_39_10b]KKR13616.1 MAG: hypothetical protein UT40_C0013G0017 [Candidatus Woesebacteria bacterium GW2011_GWA1_39_21b]OGM23084.1 MAG: hypothetical protein A2865_01995 [Candidatus Woesebacteria bacterium RIFCSPHIGHO2_01_FULL_39_17]OGM61535.1 MAG: hypothetical protein A3A52_04225 [Candidatus Woesebacteria b